MTTLFVSDLHLDPSRPRTTAQFLDLLAGPARQAEALYVLGDLFEAWVGEDDPGEIGSVVAEALAALGGTGVPIHFIRGNRDFLLGTGYARRCRMRILPDPCVVVLYDRPVLLLHGDLLCTGDHAYQQWRRQARDPDWQAAFLAQPLAARQALAAQARAASREYQQAQAGSEAIMDAAPATVEQWFVRWGVDRMIHGHTHRPAIHHLLAGDRPRTRVVLGDWYRQPSLLWVDADGLALGR